MTSSSNDGTPSIRPAFRNRRGALVFAVLLGAVFLFPLVNERIVPHWPYRTSGLHRGTAHMAFQEQVCAAGAPPIDVLVVGDSQVHFGIEPNVLETLLSAELHRPIRVVTLGFEYTGEELYYLALRRCLATKHPTLVLMNLSKWDFGDTDAPHPFAYRVLETDEGDDFYAGVPLRYRFLLYGHALLGTPRTILNALRRPPPDVYEPGFRGNFLGKGRVDLQPFVLGDPHPPRSFTAAQALYSDATRPQWEFVERPLAPYPQIYVDKIRALLAAHHVPLGLIEATEYRYRHYPKVRVRQFWPRLLPSVPMIGLPGPVLFQGLSEEQIAPLYQDPIHFNLNGARYYTYAVAPAILELMKKAQDAH